MTIRERLLSRLDRGTEPETPAGLKPAGVLVALYREEASDRILLTERSPDLTSHGGQISFPGGGLEEGESFWQAARRETMEEIGLAVDDGVFTGRLPSVVIPVSGFFVVPSVAVLPEAPLAVASLSPEVARVFSVSLAELRHRRGEETYLRGGKRGPWPVFHLEEGRLWGATARMVDALLFVLSRDGGWPS